MKIFRRKSTEPRFAKNKSDDHAEICGSPSFAYANCGVAPLNGSAPSRNNEIMPDAAYLTNWGGSSPLLQNVSDVHLLQELHAYRRDLEACERKIDEMQCDLAESNALNSRIIACATEGIIITNARNIIQSVNPAFEKSTGYTAREVIGRTPALLKSGHQDEEFYRNMWDVLKKDGQWRGEVWNRRKSGEIYPEWLSISAVKDHRQEVTHYVGIFSDLHTQEYIMERLHNLAYYDVLTGLPNRRLFLDRLEVSLSRARREKHMLGVMFVDLDHFKQVNDTLGHRTGDELLVAVTERMKNCLREEDTLARLGGDEFTVILPVLPHQDAASNVAQKFLDCYRRPVIVDGRELHVTASIGISIFSGNGEDADSLLSKADLAMYRIKETGRNGYMLHDTEMDSCPFPKKTSD